MGAINDGQDEFDVLVEMYSQFRFAITVENALLPGYFTEKMPNALLAQSMPVYAGNHQVGKEIAPGAMVDCTAAMQGTDEEEAELDAAWQRLPFAEARLFFHRKMDARLSACTDKIRALEADRDRLAKALSGPAAKPGSVFDVASYSGVRAHLFALLDAKRVPCVSFPESTLKAEG